MAFELPPLPYDYDALEPVISKETMTYHHDKHHAAYTAKLNEGVAADPKLEGKSIEEILGMISSLPPLVRNNGGGYWNHDFFWKIMTSPSKSGQPTGALKVVSTPNQDNPLMDDAKDKGTPILGNDVWEHAYYLTYKNDRPGYLKAWWDVVNWEEVGRRFDAA